MLIGTVEPWNTSNIYSWKKIYEHNFEIQISYHHCTERREKNLFIGTQWCTFRGERYIKEWVWSSNVNIIKDEAAISQQPNWCQSQESKIFKVLSYLYLGTKKLIYLCFGTHSLFFRQFQYPFLTV